MKIDPRGTRSPKIALTLALSLAFMPIVLCPAQAEITSVNDPVFGTGAFTLDTATGLEWLDLTQTDSQSYDDVSAQFEPGGEYAGLRYASSAEAYTFFLDAGIPADVINGGNDYLNGQAYGTIAALQDLVGYTEADWSIGITSDVTDLGPPFPGPTRVVAELYTQSFNGRDAAPYTDLANIDVSPADGEKDLGNGSWLVRQVGTTTPPTTVPEPPAALIPLAAMLMLFSLRYRRS